MLASVPKTTVADRLTGRAFPPIVRLGALALLAIGAIVLFMTIEAHGNWDFILPFRGRKVFAMVLVGYAIAASTIMFQTITNNHILTPSIMGFDALYMLIQTVVVLLDEPLNNLDMRHSISMMQQLRRIVEELGKTVVIVLHDINFASWYSDQIVAMRDGKVVYHAGPEVVITPQALYDLYDVDVQVETICGKSVGVYYGGVNEMEVQQAQSDRERVAVQARGA